jgi:hypothetical protein
MTMAMVVVVTAPSLIRTDVARGNVDIASHILRFLGIGADGPRFGYREGRRHRGKDVDPLRGDALLDPGRERIVELRSAVRYPGRASSAGKRRSEDASE